jgi:hypothetical protein
LAPLDAADFPQGFLFPSNPDPIEIMQNVNLALQSPYFISGEDLTKYLEESNFTKHEGVSRRNSWIAASILDWIHPKKLS